jgi:colicin import membrane protein
MRLIAFLVLIIAAGACYAQPTSPTGDVKAPAAASAGDEGSQKKKLDDAAAARKNDDVTAARERKVSDERIARSEAHWKKAMGSICTGCIPPQPKLRSTTDELPAKGRSVGKLQATPQLSGENGRELQRTAAPASEPAQRLNPSQRVALMGLLRDQLHLCWKAPIAAKDAVNPPVPTVRVSLNRDGSLVREPGVTNASADPLFRAVADSARSAARRCSPLHIPAEFQTYYQDWKELIVAFDPRNRRAEP